MDILLNIAIFLPALGIPFILLFKNNTARKWIALAATLLTFFVSLPLIFNFDISASSAPQFLTVSEPLSVLLDVKYMTGLDGLSLLLFMLTAFLGPIVILSSWNSVQKHIAGYLSMLLLLQTASLGVFAALDILVFYVFFELSLIPMYFLIGIWGGKERIQATVKFFIYTMAGSLIMLVGLIYLGYDAGAAMGTGTAFSTDWMFLSGESYQIGLEAQTYLFLAFSLAFCIKVPLFPFHTWLPYAHTEAPAAGSVVLASVMLKMGTYGLLRICLPLFPNAFAEFAPWMATLAVIGIIYGALVAMVQKDFKKLVAYSSVSHLGFVVLGLFALNTVAVQGAIIQMVNHGLSTGALFLIIGMLYDRRHTRLIKDYGGIAKKMPILTAAFMVATFASIGLPGLNGFVGEFLILNGAFFSELYGHGIFTLIATVGVILAAVYMLWMFQRVMFGPLNNPKNEALIDLNARETGLLIPLIILMFWIGFHPVDFTKYSEAQVEKIISSSNKKRIAIMQQSKTDITLPDWTASFYDIDNFELQMASK